MTYFMGIDGGGSNLRVAVVRDDLSVCGQSHRSTVNPTSIGRENAAQIIQSAMQEALDNASLSPENVSGVGIGIAGASALYATGWLREIVSGVMPHAHIFPSSDNEIALVGAHAERRGVLALAGTGSVTYGVNDAGESAQVGGWGYLVGDEGSGFRIGVRALRAATQVLDGRMESTALKDAIFEALGLTAPQELVLWLYETPMPRIRDIARLAPLVMEVAANGDEAAMRIVETEARELASMCRTVIHRLRMREPRIAFAGGVLVHRNPLSFRLCELLNLPDIPVPKHPPVIGAALLAQIYMTCE